METVPTQLKKEKRMPCNLCGKFTGILHNKCVPAARDANGTALYKIYPQEYRAFSAAQQRCKNPKKHNYATYGGRGIEFRFTSFEEFFAELGKKPSPEYSLNRINNDGHYEKGNVEWATLESQSRNTTRSRKITVKGVTKNIQDWRELLGLSVSTITVRIGKYGWCEACAVTLPRHSKCPHRGSKKNV